jgi:hypothetical protein
MDSLTVATWVLAAVTLAYVVLTALVMKQNHRLVARQTTPEVIAFVEVSKQHAAHLVVQNVGAGVARNVRVGAPAEWRSHRQIGALGEVGFIAKGIGVLPSGSRMHTMIAVLPQMDKERTEPIPIDLSFQDSDGKSYSSHFDLDLRELLGIRAGSIVAPGSMIGVE